MSVRPSRTDTITTGDLFVVWKTADGDFRLASADTVLQFIQNSLTFPAAGVAPFVTQYAAPSATAFDIVITDGASNDSNVHLILTPTAGFAAGTVTLPPTPGAVDKQEVLVNCTQQVTALTVDGNGATAVTGEPASLGADDFFRLKYDLATKTWYRVG